jgi:LPS export ABC transporter protein LptC
MEGLSLNEIQDGAKRWVLEADRARYLQDRREIEVTGIRLEFYGEGGRVIRLNCREGRVDTATRSLTLAGEVEVSDGDLTVTTGLIRYLPQERLLLAPEEVTLTTPRLRVTGRDLSIFVAHRRLVLKEHRVTEVRDMEGWRL